MARQPIYDKSQGLAAYELLYRSGTANFAGNIAPEDSARSLVSTLIDIGLTRLVGDSKAFINIDEEILLSGAALLLPKDKVVIEILETVRATPETIEMIRRLRTAGFTIALDDFDADPHSKEFLPFASIIKLDVMALGSRLPFQVKLVQGPGVTLLAEKVETRAEYEQCKILGFELFQGYFFSKPEIIKGRSIPPNRLTSLQIAARLQDPTLTIGQLEELIVTDLPLSHRLLKMVRSAQMGMPDHVQTIRQAVMFLGIQTVASLATLIAISASSNKPPDLLATALVRAKMCELITDSRKLPGKERSFTVGLFSVIDALLDTPMEDLLSQLPLDAEINSALTDPESAGELGDALRIVLAFEQGHWDLIEPLISLSEINSSYQKAVTWAADRMGAFDQQVAA